MKNKNVEKMLYIELEVLNNKIDMKIIKGLTYAREAKQHKYLLARLIQSKKTTKTSIFSKLSFVPSFLL